MFFLLLQQEATPTVRGVFQNLYYSFLNSIPGILSAVVVFVIFYLIASVGRRIIAYTAPRVKADSGAVLLLSRVYYYGILLFGILTALPLTGLNVSALIAGLGLTGFALGFALKDVLSNLISGIMLLIYRPFHIGDQISMGPHQGIITMIRMRDTVVESYDGRTIVIPNTKLITEVVINERAESLLRGSVEMQIPASANLSEAREIFRRVLKTNAAITGRTEPLVIVKENDGRSATLEGIFWYDARRAAKLDLEEEIRQAVIEALDRAGISVRERQDAQSERQRDADLRVRLDEEDEEDMAEELVHEQDELL